MSGWRAKFLAGYVSEDSRSLGEWIIRVCQLMNAWAIASQSEWH